MGFEENLAAFLVLLGLVMYSVSAGADFGGGVWTALARGPRAAVQREALFEAIGPVWETNHVWLVYIVVVLLSCFPRGFEALFIALVFPLVFSLVGINFRGAAFVFRHFGRAGSVQLPGMEAVFSIASVLTPFFMGMAVTAVADGRILIGGAASGPLTVSATGPAVWITPFTVIGGLTGLAICAYVTPIYMTARTAGALREDFRRNAIAGALALGLLTTAEAVVSAFDARLFFDRLVRPAPLLFVALAVLSGGLTLFLLFKRAYGPARWTAGFTVAFTITGFTAALYPYMLIGQMSFAQAAAGRPTLFAVLATLPAGAAILVPSLYFLYRTFGWSPLPGRPYREE